jgi:ABC-type uncharacterized transport system ATPase subunit
MGIRLSFRSKIAYSVIQQLVLLSVGTLGSLDTMTEPLLEVRDLAVMKAKDIPIFSKLNFVVNAGDIVVIQGKSGSG